MSNQVIHDTFTIDWYPVERGGMPIAEGNYLVAFSDGSVETFPITEDDIAVGVIKISSNLKGEYWARHPVHPDI